MDKINKALYLWFTPQLAQELHYLALFCSSKLLKRYPILKLVKAGFLNGKCIMTSENFAWVWLWILLRSSSKHYWRQLLLPGPALELWRNWHFTRTDRVTNLACGNKPGRHKLCLICIAKSASEKRMIYSRSYKNVLKKTGHLVKLLFLINNAPFHLHKKALRVEKQ